VASAGPVVLDMVVAVADDDPISSSELRRYITAQGKTPPADLTVAPTPEVRRALQEMVVERLMKKEAEEAGIRAGEEEINSYIAEIKRQNKVDDRGLEALIAQQGLSIEDYRKQVATDITKARIISSRVRSRVNVTDEDIEKYVTEHPQESPTAGDVRIEQAFFKLEGSESPEVLRAQAEEKLAEVKGGKNFAQVAGSGYVDLGFVKPGDLKDELQETARNTAPGSVSELIQTDSGIYFLKVSEAPNEPGAIDASTKDRIKKQIFDARMKEQLDKFLNEELLSKYHVEYKL